MNIWYFLAMMAIGFLAIRYNKWITDSTGRIDFAEKYIGQGGTYTFWTLFGAAAMLGSFYFLFGGKSG